MDRLIHTRGRISPFSCKGQIYRMTTVNRLAFGEKPGLASACTASSLCRSSKLYLSLLPPFLAPQASITTLR